MLKLDHLAVAAENLADGAAFVEQVLGVELSAGGDHDLMGTHNMLLGLGDVYLEVIAVNPEAPAPGQPRWFDLDHFVGAPRLTNWVCRCADLEAEITASPPGIGVPTALSRGDLSWRMAVPADGRLPFENAYPALIQWLGALHPVDLLQDRGCRLLRLELGHPQAEALRQALSDRIVDPRIAIHHEPEMVWRAEIETPHGVRVLQ